jgi:hypothetical protein
MTLFRLFTALVALFVAAGVFAQSGERGSVPPGQSRDGGAPSDGALKGGSILPGETAGIPDKDAARTGEAVAEKRCEELSGTLREDCLKQAREAAAGPTLDPGLDPSGIRKKSPARAD